LHRPAIRASHAESPGSRRDGQQDPDTVQEQRPNDSTPPVRLNLLRQTGSGGGVEVRVLRESQRQSLAGAVQPTFELMGRAAVATIECLGDRRKVAIEAADSALGPPPTRVLSRIDREQFV